MGSGWEGGPDASTGMPCGRGVWKCRVGVDVGIGEFEVRCKRNMCRDVGIEFVLSSGSVVAKRLITSTEPRERACQSRGWYDGVVKE